MLLIFFMKNVNGSILKALFTGPNSEELCLVLEILSQFLVIKHYRSHYNVGVCPPLKSKPSNTRYISPDICLEGLNRLRNEFGLRAEVNLQFNSAKFLLNHS